MKSKELRIIVNLDSLFDTRLGTIVRINPNWIEPLIQGGYHARIHNHLSLINKDIDNDIVTEVFNNRDADTLKVSKSTNIVNLLEIKIREHLMLMESTPHKRDIVIIVNTYPYNLSTEIVRSIIEELSGIWNTKNIRRIHISDKDLTPEFLIKKYNRLITHDLDSWLVPNVKKLEITPMPLFNLTVPTYINDIIGFRLALQKKNKNLPETNLIAGIIEIQRRKMASLLELETCPLADYSVTLPPNFNQQEEENNSES